MAYIESNRFEGTLTGHGVAIAVSFEAEVNDDGRLRVRLDHVPSSAEAMRFHGGGRLGDRVEQCVLAGEAADNATFHTDHFAATDFAFSTDISKGIGIQGACAVADLSVPLAKPFERSVRLWHLRQFRSIHPLQADTEWGELSAGGPDDLAQDSQAPSGFLRIEHPSGIGDDEWWEETDRLFRHVGRVMSLVYDTYLLPIMDKRFAGDRMTCRVYRRTRVASPFLPPFHVGGRHEIFRTAAVSYPARAEAMAIIEPAIRWLTAPVALWEQRIISAMTALECLIDQLSRDGGRLFLEPKPFDKLARKVRALLRSEAAPDDMKEKVPDLNRRPFRDQLDGLLAERSIGIADFPDGWLNQVTKGRNFVVHTGLAPVTDRDSTITFEQTVWPREVATRIILDQIGYSGPYQSPLHGNGTIHFPTGLSMKDWAETLEGKAAIGSRSLEDP